MRYESNVCGPDGQVLKEKIVKKTRRVRLKRGDREWRGGPLQHASVFSDQHCSRRMCPWFCDIYAADKNNKIEKEQSHRQQAKNEERPLGSQIHQRCVRKTRKEKKKRNRNQCFNTFVRTLLTRQGGVCTRHKLRVIMNYIGNHLVQGRFRTNLGR